MSTISTHLNWGSSYIVNDFYKQQIKKDASEKELVMVGRISTVVLMVLSALFALYLKNAKQLFDIIIMFGAGTGLIFILRWFWWRINSWSEISAMIISGVVSLIFTSPIGDDMFGNDAMMPSWAKLPGIVLITTMVWISVTLLTKPENNTVLQNFYKKIQPGGPGWNKVVTEAKQNNIDIVNNVTGWSVPSGILALLLGCFLVYGVLFTTGHIIYGNLQESLILGSGTIIAGVLLIRVWKKIGKNLIV